MTPPAGLGPTKRPDRDRMRAYMQIVGGILLGLGLAAAVGLNPGLIFAGYTLGLGLLLPADPDTAGDQGNRSR
jgi:hypothetical protein